MRVAGRGNADAPEIIGVLLALDDANLAALFDRFGDFVGAIQDRGVDAFRALLPAAFAVWMAEPAFDFGAGRIAHLAETNDALGIAVDVGRDDLLIGLRARALRWA